MVPPSAPSPPAPIDLSTSPLMAPAISNSPALPGGSPFRVRIGERAITDGLCALLQGMLEPHVSQPPLTANSLLLLLQKMAPPALTLGRSAAPSWLQENTQQVVLEQLWRAWRLTDACRTATSSCGICSAVCPMSTRCSLTLHPAPSPRPPSTPPPYSPGR
jgi:hypothetical protein